jgi:hypothetical protein
MGGGGGGRDQLAFRILPLRQPDGRHLPLAGEDTRTVSRNLNVDTAYAG